MSHKLFVMTFILATLGTAAFIVFTLVRARRRYWKRYLAILVTKRPTFLRWWLRKYARLLSAGVAVYLVTVIGAGYLERRSRPAPLPNRYAAKLTERSERQKELWKSYVEQSATVEKAPQESDQQLKLAQIQRDLGLGNKALNSYRKVLQLDPQSLPARFEMGCLAADMGEALLAESQATELARNWPKRPESQLLMARIASRGGKGDQAIVQWQGALVKDPGNREALTHLATAYLQRRSYADAARLAETGLRLAPSDTDLSLILARSQVGLGRSAEARVTLRRAAEQDAATVAPLIMLAELQVRQGEYLPAIASYEEVLKRSPDHLLAMNNIALLTADHGYDLERAAAVASRLYAKYPGDPALADTLGWVLFRQGKLGEALPLLQLAAVRLPDNPVHRYHYGALLVKSGRSEEGRKELKAALGLSREFDGADKARALLGGKN